MDAGYVIQMTFCIKAEMEPVTVTNCHLDHQGVYLTFSDGQTFFYPQALLYSFRYTHAEHVTELPEKSALNPAV